VKNTGKVAGAEAVQLYVSAPQAQTPRGSLATPSIELRRFAKTRRLEPGESQTLSLELGTRELASFDPQASAWVARAGRYTLRAGASSTDLRQTTTLDLQQAAQVDLR
jgi:beta-glucosidase